MSSGNIYKGHMDKANGGWFVGGRWGWVVPGAMWSENIDNCTWTTIKKYILKILNKNKFHIYTVMNIPREENGKEINTFEN